MRNNRVIARWRSFGLALALLACSETSVDTAVELKDGDMDPNAPEGWPLAIGDPDIVGWSLPGGVRDDFEYWERNCCINWVDGTPYTAKWRTVLKDGQSWDVYEGHVPAEPIVFPKMSDSESARLKLHRFETDLARLKENNPELFYDPEQQKFFARYRAFYQSKIERYEAEGR